MGSASPTAANAASNFTTLALALEMTSSGVCGRCLEAEEWNCANLLSNHDGLERKIVQDRHLIAFFHDVE